MEQLDANLRQLRVWSDNCAENFLSKRLMVEAEIARITGDETAAADLYDEAIDAAHDGRFVQDEALANELAARFVMERRPNSRVGAMYLRDARYALPAVGRQPEGRRARDRVSAAAHGIPGRARDECGAVRRRASRRRIQPPLDRASPTST